MNWDELLNDGRFRPHSQQKSEFDGRNEFEDDYTRLIFSSPIRRLQDKAQVFPLDNSDFVRTRLTHSIEVSAIGRSLGASVERALVSKRSDVFNKEHVGKLSSILAAAGLIHDLGNPPFGHFGELAIQHYFEKKLEEPLFNTLQHLEKEDFKKFEGNAQCFRLLTKLQYVIDENGYNCTFATLASMLKYPRSSVEGNKGRDYPRVSYKKFGYLTSEKETFNLVKEKTGIEAFRHPLAFLLEAADDIAYSAADIEDGFRKKVLSFETIRDVMSSHLKEGSDKDKELLNSLEIYRNDVHANYPNRDEIAIQRFRIKAQGIMIASVVDAFLKHQDSILNGEFDEEILAASDASLIRQALESLATDYIFKDKNILSKELVGNKVISGLLDFFVDSAVSENRKKTKTIEGKYYHLISNNYRFITEQFPSKVEEGEASLYDRILLATDFICGMTDSYAIDLYRKLTGITL